MTQTQELKNSMLVVCLNLACLNLVKNFCKQWQQQKHVKNMDI